MANRVIRDWTTSEIMDSVSLEAEVFFTRLIMKADDFGSYHANIKLLKAGLFPLKEVSRDQLTKWMRECIAADLIFMYEVEGKGYIRIRNFGQRLRNMRNAFPHPADNSQQLAANGGDLMPETETKQKQETKQETEPADATVVGKKDSRETDVPFIEGSAVKKAWDEWEQYRKEKGKKLTASTVQKQIQFLGGRGDPEIIEILNQSIRNGWIGLFDLKPYNNKNNGRTTVKRSSDAVIQSGRSFGSFE